MKKLTIMFVVIALSCAVNAASFLWKAGNIYASNGTSKYSGAVTLYATGVSDAIYTATASAGAVNVEFTTDKLSGGNSYDFYFVFEDNGKAFTSSSKTVAAQATATASIQFGNMATATQNASNWAPVPEPTSALLMVLGIAGLALKRKRV